MSVVKAARCIFGMLMFLSSRNFRSGFEIITVASSALDAFYVCCLVSILISGAQTHRGIHNVAIGETTSFPLLHSPSALSDF